MFFYAYNYSSIKRIGKVLTYEILLYKIFLFIYRDYNHRHYEFFNKQEVLLLLKNLEIRVLEESCERNDRGIIDHSFTIVAQKK